MMMLPLFGGPEQLERMKEQMRRRAERAMERAIPFDEFKIPRKIMDVGIIAESFKPENPLETILPDVPVDQDPKKPTGIIDPSGTLRYCRKRLPKGAGLQLVVSESMFMDDGRLFFTDDVIVPTLEYKRRDFDKWHVWMSLTPYELKSQYSGIRAATGRVVIAGLGMGWLFKQIARKKTVKEIVVIEKDKNLIDWFGRKLCESEEKVEDLICDDFFNKESDWPHRFEKGTRFILDIWPGFGDAAWDFRLEQLRATGWKGWAWGSPRGSRR